MDRVLLVCQYTPFMPLEVIFGRVKRCVEAGVSGVDPPEMF